MCARTPQSSQRNARRLPQIRVLRVSLHRSHDGLNGACSVGLRSVVDVIIAERYATQSIACRHLQSRARLVRLRRSHDSFNGACSASLCRRLMPRRARLQNAPAPLAYGQWAGGVLLRQERL